MNSKEFMKLVEEVYKRDKEVLLQKEREYTVDGNRLGQFYHAGYIQGTKSTEALVGMMTKHFTSIAGMSKSPLAFTFDEWKEKLTDLRNYAYLLEGLISDMKEHNFER